MKVVTILGTRPEIIRLARVMPALDRFTDHTIVHTGQNYDYELNEMFFEELGLRVPDIILNTDTSSLGSMLGTIMVEIEPVLEKVQPDAVLILGDTNSSIAGIMVKRMRIPLYHMEAGNRCFDASVPEETNRKIIDRISDFNLVYTEHARRHLLSEGMPHRNIYLTGSPMREVLEFYRDRIEASEVLKQLELRPNEYILASIHREENVDSKRNLRELLRALEGASQHFGMPVLVSTHPRTRKRLDELGEEHTADQVIFAQPFGFFDYNCLQMKAFCTLSDSGTISEESAILEFPAVTVRNSMERPEAMDTGGIVLTGLDARVIVRSIEVVTKYWADEPNPPTPPEYSITNVAQRVVNLIVGTSGLINQWAGIQRKMD